MTQVVAVVGPTASGKTPLAIALAEAVGTEIISADSMQFYRGLEIGTGQPTPAEAARVKHHFVGSLDPSEEISAGSFRERALPIVKRLNDLGKPAVVVGGSGLYIRALIDGLFESPPKDDSLRSRLEAEAERMGTVEMHARLTQCDPRSAGRIEPNDTKRIVRALEIFELTGRPLSSLHESEESQQEPLSSIQIGVDWPRAELYERINRRVDTMIAGGWINEVRSLLAAGHRSNLLRLRPIGYIELIEHLDGTKALEETVESVKMFTRRYAKRQLTWFRKERRIRWLSGHELETKSFQVEHFLNLHEIVL